MSAIGVDPAGLVVPALRLDRWSPDEVDERVGAALELGVGGFVLFGGEAEAVARLTERIRRRAGRDLWIAADLERGAGQQFRGLTELPPPAALAYAPDPRSAVERAAALTAAEALSVGVNWVLAPVLDLDAEWDNPIVATRSFGADPEAVADLGIRWIDACQDAGAMACAKHFPGHGRTLVDSHVELPSVAASREELERDLRPFRAVSGRVGSLMVAHVAYPALAGTGPATLERAIVHDLIRGELAFRGPVATDAMIMGGVGADDAAAGVEAVRAGCDVILYPSDVARTIELLQAAVREERAFEGLAAEAIRRGREGLARFPGDGRRTPAGSPGALAAALETIVASRFDPAGWDPAASTVVVPLSDDPEVGPPAGRDGPLGDVLAGALAQAGWSVAVAPPAAEEPLGAVRQTLVVLAATPRGWKGRAGVSPAVAATVRRLVLESERGMVVVLGHLRWLEALDVPGICAWSTETIMERAAGEWIRRRVEAAG